MNYLSKYPIKNKTVLLRCDFNVPVKNNQITDDSKIVKSLETIKFLLQNNNRIILLSHFGRVKAESDKQNNSLFIVFEELKKYIDLEFVENPLNLDKVKNTSEKHCFLVENTRYTDVPEKRESANDLDLANYWASFADVFVIDAFASLHRVHSSTAGISKYLPTYIGFLVERELENLKLLIEISSRPFVVIMGGAKVDDKIQIIEGLLNRCDKLILTGGILNTFLKVSGRNIGDSLVCKDEKILESVKKILNNSQEKIYFTNKFIVKRSDSIEEVDLDQIQDGDIIYDNIIHIKEIIKDSEIIFLNGTCGVFEENVYAKGTLNLLENLSNCNAKIIAGGGDTVSAISIFGYENNFDYLSSGGGATLEYVAYGKLKALDWINSTK
ncbi:MAG: phosphoglycerate kinase [Firmicutes bacterium]|nr:phosphoglycerate kinase [Bacillota bacterium]